jgi:RecA-family ATPase
VPRHETEQYDDAEHDARQDWVIERTIRALSEARGPALETLRETFDFSSLATPSPETDPEPSVAPSATAATVLAEDVTGEIDAADLLALELPPLRELVPGIIAEGTTVVAAPPKIGKSVLMYQLAVETALGGTMLGQNVNGGVPGDVLYLALEDGRRRGQARLRAVLGQRRMPKGRLKVRWEAKPMGDGFEQFLADWIDNHERAALVIIDTLGRIRGEQTGDTRRNAYQVDVRDFGDRPPYQQGARR